MNSDKILEDAILYLDGKMAEKKREELKKIWEDGEQTIPTTQHQLITPEQSVDTIQQELKTGIEVEKEHKDVYELLKKWSEENNLSLPVSEDEFYTMIAKAHLREIKDYYTRLTKMETEAKQAKEVTPIVKQDIQVKSDGVETV